MNLIARPSRRCKPWVQIAIEFTEMQTEKVYLSVGLITMEVEETAIECWFYSANAFLFTLVKDFDAL